MIGTLAIARHLLRQQDVVYNSRPKDRGFSDTLAPTQVDEPVVGSPASSTPRRSGGLLLTFAVLLATALPSIVSAQSYTITDLGALPNRPNSYAMGVNKKGQVVGYAQGDSGPFTSARAFVVDNGVMREVPTGFAANCGSCTSIATSINTQGDIAGSATFSDPNNPHAVLWRNGAIVDLPPPAYMFAAKATAVNDSDQVVGWGYRPFEPIHRRIFLWQNGQLLDENSPNFTIARIGSQFGFGINNKGQVIGTAGVYDTPGHAYLWQPGSLTDLGFDGAPLSINEASQVVGYQRFDSIHKAVLWDNGSLSLIGSLGGSNSEAYSINNLGQVVGIAQDANGKWRPFLLRNGVPVDLNALLTPGQGWDVQVARVAANLHPK